MRWYFDYISPYAYLQSTQLQKLNNLQAVKCVPLLFAGLLKHWGNVGPAEIEPKRQWTFEEITWLAHRDNIPLTLPTVHPFNPLPLLRLGIAHNNEIEVVQRLFNFVWLEGHTPADESAFLSLLDELGTTPDKLKSESIKDQLHNNGNQAINKGIFGVPTLEMDNKIYWGYNATEMVATALSTPEIYPQKAINQAALLPQGIHRKTGPNTTATVQPERETPRIPLIPIDLAEPADLVSAIRERRGGELIALDRLLLHSQPLAEGWNHYLGNIREHFTVEQKLRELAMCTVAVLNRAEYEFSQHAPLYIKEGGSDQKTKLLRSPDKAQADQMFSEDERLTIALSIQMTTNIQIDDHTFDQALSNFGNEHLVELVATIAAYNMVSRFLVAFELHS